MPRYVINEVRNAKSDARYVRGFDCPNCQGSVDFARFDEGRQDCPHCNTRLRLEVYSEE